MIERETVINGGLISNPYIPTRLNEAIDFKGRCNSMCSGFEATEREMQTVDHPMELSESGKLDVNEMVKAYCRSATGSEQPFPSDVRIVEPLGTVNSLLLP
ncbi:hypothetical protein K501DRAFT_269044 [Backusella circina FSU 941]|nr:hypothetical protein K501DRAFT_269044 [Backusella circina FSU 941]